MGPEGGGDGGPGGRPDEGGPGGPFSMTGYGAARSLAPPPGASAAPAPASPFDASPPHATPLEVEIRSVNHRQLKLTTRVPEGLSGLVPQLEGLLRARLARGAVHVQVRQASAGPDSGHRLDRALLVQLHQELTAAAAELEVEPPRLGEVALLPGVVRPDDARPDLDAVWSVLGALTREALDRLTAMRAREGAGIARDLASHVQEMLREADAIEVEAPRVVEDQARRLRGRVRQLLEDPNTFDPNELAREVAILADRSDISEELQRLRSHARQLEATLRAAAGPVGRKLEFLAQELMREANTMASKSHDTGLIERILAVKLCVERIREQLANLE